MMVTACGAPARRAVPATVGSALPRPELRLYFRGEQPVVRAGAQEWEVKGVSRSEMVFSPDGKRFAYLRDDRHAAAPAPAAGAEEVGAKGSQRRRVLIRNIAGDPVNEFLVYRPGEPELLTWLDDRRVGYLAPSEPSRARSQRLFVTHDVQSGEVLSARSGAEFIWDGTRRHVAFLSGPPKKQVLVIDGETVWPRTGTTRFHGELVWSPDGHGMAVVETGADGVTPRLVVLVEWRDRSGDLVWPIPPDALAPGLKVFWAGDSKVVIGQTAFQPKFAAGWERVQ